MNFLVVGDIILDKYWFGSSSRLSPEAPVPVLELDRKKYTLGGAANVANNLKALGNTVYLASMIGKDKAGEYLKETLNKKNINCMTVLQSPRRKTTIKTRYIAHTQQLLRIDREIKTDLGDKDSTEIIQNINKILDTVKLDCIILSDYAKGVLTREVCQQIITQARQKHIPVLVDPKGTNWDKYKGATSICPNTAELLLITKNPLDIIKRLELEFITWTRGEEGITYVGTDGLTDFKTTVKKVIDVCGAGDTVISVLAHCLALGIGRIKAIELANKAGGYVVQKQGVVTIPKRVFEKWLTSN